MFNKNPTPTVPIINIGPQFAQKEIVRFASPRDSLPSRNKSVVIFAPTGYPDIMLIKYIKLEIPLVLYNLEVIGDKSFEIGSITPSPARNFVYIKKGNSVGKRTVAQTVNELNATFEYVSGLATIAINTKNKSNDNKKAYISLKFLFLCLTIVFVFIIIKYVFIILNYNLKLKK